MGSWVGLRAGLVAVGNRNPSRNPSLVTKMNETHKIISVYAINWFSNRKQVD